MRETLANIKWKMKYNSLKDDYDALEQEIKDGLFEQIIDKKDLEIKNKRLTTENRNLREKVKHLKEIIKEGK